MNVQPKYTDKSVMGHSDTGESNDEQHLTASKDVSKDTINDDHGQPVDETNVSSSTVHPNFNYEYI